MAKVDFFSWFKTQKTYTNAHTMLEFISYGEKCLQVFSSV